MKIRQILVFFRLTTFFFRNKNFLSKEQLLFSFLCIEKQKKISERSENFWKKIFLKIYLTDFEKKKIQNFSDHSEIFFCFPIHKKLNKSCSLDKNFLFLKKKVVSLKKTKICRIFKTNREIFLPVHSPNLYGISIWKMHGRSHGNFFICFGDFQQQCIVCSTWWLSAD